VVESAEVPAPLVLTLCLIPLVNAPMLNGRSGTRLGSGSLGRELSERVAVVWPAWELRDREEPSSLVSTGRVSEVGSDSVGLPVPPPCTEPT
jgi:hypothetical protein